MVGCRSSIPLPILGPDGAIARRLPSYEARPEQLEMAEAVARAIEARSHLMVEAGTGVGKSFAYLVPAILAAAETKQEGRRLDAHDQPPGAVAPEGLAVPPGGDAAGVHGRPGQGAVELHQPPPARGRRGAGRGDVPEARGIRPARRDPALGRPDGRRQPLRPRLPPLAGASGTPSPARTAIAWAGSARDTRIASTSRPGGGCGRPTSWSSTTPCS